MKKIFRNLKFKLPVTLHEWLIVSAGFSIVLLLSRMMVTGTREYVFLGWNLFLAWIPYSITRFMSIRLNWTESFIKRLLLVILWLLFVPNSFYIITDLYHLARVHSAPRWFDLLLVFSFAWNGLVFGILSLRRMEMILIPRTANEKSLVLIAGFMWLNALGIYIGRYLRYNSWDIVADPFSFLYEISRIFLQPDEHLLVWGMTLAWGTFMTLLYFSLRRFGEYFHA